MDKVKRVLSEVFGDKLARNAVTFTKPSDRGSDRAGGRAEAAPPESRPKRRKRANRAATCPRTQSVGDGGREFAKRGPGRRAAEVGTGRAEWHWRRRRQWRRSKIAAAEGHWRDARGAREASAPAEKSAPAKPVDVPRPKAAPAEPLPSETPPKAPGAAAEKPAAGPDPYAGGSQSRLTFKVPLNQLAVKQLITSAIEANKLAPESVPFQVSRPDFVEGDNAKYNEWDLKVLLPPAKAEALLTHARATHRRQPDLPRLEHHRRGGGRQHAASMPSTPWWQAGSASSSTSGCGSRAWPSAWRPWSP